MFSPDGENLFLVYVITSIKTLNNAGMAAYVYQTRSQVQKEIFLVAYEV